MNKEEIQRFQDDLKNGLSIEQALRKYNISFREAIDSMPRFYGRKKKRKCRGRAKYIQQMDNRFHVRKTIKGKTRSFGSYSSLEDAIKLRDYCIEHGWKQRKVDEYCETLGITRRTYHTNKVRFR